MVALARDTSDEVEEIFVLFAELVVETLGDALADVGAGAAGDVQQREGFLVIERDEERIEFLEDGLTGLALAPIGIADAERLARIAADPLPDLARFRIVCENDEVLVGGFGDLALHVAAECGIWEFSIWFGQAMPNDEATFVGDGLEGDFLTGDGHCGGGCVPIPAKFLGEEAGKVELLQSLAGGRAVEWHGEVGKIEIWKIAVDGSGSVCVIFCSDQCASDLIRCRDLSPWPLLFLLGCQPGEDVGHRFCSSVNQGLYPGDDVLIDGFDGVSGFFLLHASETVGANVAKLE